MNAEKIYNWLCEGYLPFGSCGITVEAIQSRIDRYQGPYKYPFDYRFQVWAPFVYKKQAMFAKLLEDKRNN